MDSDGQQHEPADLDAPPRGSDVALNYTNQTQEEAARPPEEQPTDSMEIAPPSTSSWPTADQNGSAGAKPVSGGYTDDLWNLSEPKETSKERNTSGSWGKGTEKASESRSGWGDNSGKEVPRPFEEKTANSMEVVPSSTSSWSAAGQNGSEKAKPTSGGYTDNLWDLSQSKKASKENDNNDSWGKGTEKASESRSSWGESSWGSSSPTKESLANDSNTWGSWNTGTTVDNLSGSNSFSNGWGTHDTSPRKQGSWGSKNRWETNNSLSQQLLPPLGRARRQWGPYPRTKPPFSSQDQYDAPVISPVIEQPSDMSVTFGNVTQAVSRLEITTRSSMVDGNSMKDAIMKHMQQIVRIHYELSDSRSQLKSAEVGYASRRQQFAARITRAKNEDERAAVEAELTGYKLQMVQQEKQLEFLINTFESALHSEVGELEKTISHHITERVQAAVLDLLRAIGGPPCNVPNVLEKALLTAAPQLVEEYMAKAAQNHRDLEAKVETMRMAAKEKDRIIADMSERLCRLELEQESRGRFSGSPPPPTEVDQLVDTESQQDLVMEPATGGCIVF
ncbi:hypothetical protein FRC17_000437 [Serendipita sp. 399]|nr:hypothetical protein FRC17_000437 [Serendipita sp. 399]